MNHFVIERKTWARGRVTGVVNELLSPETGKKCCLGFACLAYGLTGNQIAHKDTPMQHSVRALLPDQGKWMGEDEPGTMYYKVSDLISANDSPYFTDDRREAEIIRLFAVRGITVEFVDELPEAAPSTLPGHNEPCEGRRLA